MSLTAKELRDFLEDVPDDMMIILAKDPEGNGYSPLSGTTDLGEVRYRAESTWAGEIVDPNEKDEDGEPYYNTDDLEEINALPECIVLWPIN